MTATKTRRLTPAQKFVLTALANGVRQLPCGVGRSPAGGVTIRTLRILGRLGLLHYCWSGGWCAIAPAGEKCEEPGEHIRRANLLHVISALEILPGRRAENSWALFNVCNEYSGLDYQSMVCAIRYGARKGLLKIGEGYDYSDRSDRSVEFA